MENLSRIRSKLESLDQLHDLVRALRALAATHAREAQGALEGLKDYVGIVEEAIVGAATLLGDAGSHSGAAGQAATRYLVVVCSEHGFVGGFNERVLDRALADRDTGEALMIVGQRGTMRASERRVPVDRSFAMTTHVGGIPALASRISEALVMADRVRVVFAEYLRGADFDIISKTVLPLPPDLLSVSRQGTPPLHHLPPDVLLAQLAEEYLFGELSLVLMHGLASENAARLRTMEAAVQNIEDKLETLRQLERSQRQNEITDELLDVLVGAEAAAQAPSDASQKG